ncbi:hypothetical protein RJ55_07985 [Drechmeria coniospora]|nr:hypothetical protein RJ55_07985 [Drechmeria coniospora]
MPGMHTNSAQKPLSIHPHLGPSHRHRDSPYPVVAIEDAMTLILEHSPNPVVVTSKVDAAIVGSVLAEPIKAEENVPAFRASIVDGYAIVAPEGGHIEGIFPVAAVSHAAPGNVKPLETGQVARITTGAPLPQGATSVVMVENTILRTTKDNGNEEDEIEIEAMVVGEGHNVREVGSDVQKGSIILEKGERISSVGGELGLLAAVGVSDVKVFRRPVVGIMSTGDELVDYDKPGPLRYGEVRDTNRISILSVIKGWGYEVVDLGIVKDNEDGLGGSLRKALRLVDVLITTGGVSMGERDLLKPTIEHSLGGTIHFGRIFMKPGKPATFATVLVTDEAGNAARKVIFSLPGNPASALVTLNMLVYPSLQKQSGVSPVGLTQVVATLGHDVLPDPRPGFQRAVVTICGEQLIATTTGGQRSSKVSSLRSANALLGIPSGYRKVVKGTKVFAWLLDTPRGVGTM